MISVQREMAERALKSIDDATAVFNDDNRGPGYWICYACGAETNAQWRDGVRIGSHEDIAHEKDCWAEHLRGLLGRLGEKDAPVAVVLPERIDESICRGHSLTLAIKWNRCIDEVARLNPVAKPCKS